MTREELLNDLYSTVCQYRMTQKEMGRIEDEGKMGTQFWRQLNALCFRHENEIDSLLEKIRVSKL